MGKISLPLLFCQLFLAFVTSVSEAQITLVKDLYPGGSLSQIGNVTIIDEALYFNTAGYGLNSNNALIRTDGSTSGTQILENYHITSMAQFGDALYYDDYSVKLLNSSGTPFNSNLTVSFDSVYITSDLLVAGDKLYFSLHDGMNSFIISYDESETVETYDVSNYYSHLYAAGDAIYFRAEKDLEYYACKIENGSIDMISKIEDYEFIYEFDFYGKIGSQVYFFPSISNNTSNYDFHTEIWQLGSGGPTTIASLPDNLAATGFTNVGAQLYFIAYDYNAYEAEPKLWKTDGTAAGTQEVDSGVETFESLFAGSTHLYYKKTNGELWSVDSGTNNKSLVASDIIEGDLVVQNDEVYFFKNGSSGPELWKSDGSASGTWLLAEGDILSTDPDEITLMGFIKDRLIFRAHSDEYGYELFKYELNYQCGAEHVVAFTPGKKQNNTPVNSTRRDPNKALNAPQENHSENFVSLGFGGSITLELGNRVYDDGSAEPEIIVVETSYGRADEMCYSATGNSYPEQAHVELSADGIQWYSLPNVYCRTSFLDIKPAVDQGMAYAKFIKITDASDPNLFPGSADGYDLDGLITCREDVALAKTDITNARPDNSEETFDPDFVNEAPDELKTKGVTVYPNPLKGEVISVEVNGIAPGNMQIEVIDMLGKLKMVNTQQATDENQLIQLNLRNFESGTYLIRVTTADNISTQKLIIQ